jgi:hypothetical protein
MLVVMARPPLGNDRAMRPRLVGVGGQRLGRCEVQVALDRQIQLAAHGLQFRQADGAEFRTSQPEVAQAIGDVGVFRVDLGKQPGAASIGREQLDDRPEVRLGLVLLLALPAKLAIAEQLLSDI